MRSRIEITRLSSKGQVVLPSSIRNAHRWAAGTEFVVEDTPQGLLLRPVVRAAPTRLEDVAGCLQSRRGRVSLAEMDAAIAQEVRARHARGRY
jgi:AbrB family looped-hinge helix DNA binding protein